MSDQILTSLGKPLRIAVVGHTNTGKTSLLRTLTRDRRFGDVSFRPGTTRHVEAARLLVRGRVVLELYDTPGVEDPIALLEYLEQQAAGERLDGPARIHQFLDSPLAATRFEQEAKVLRQMLRSDAAFYVIDSRDPVLAKHRDELELLGSCGIPLLPLLNFVADAQAQEAPWREALARVGLHAIVRFDTVAPASDGERLLYEKLSTLLDEHRSTLQALIASHEEDSAGRHRAALQQIAEMLIDVAACRFPVRETSASELEKGVGALNKMIRQREQRCVDALLSLYDFDAEDIEGTELPMTDGRWEDDLFDPETLQAMGVRVGSGAAAGAAAGMGIDLAVGGVTLGAAAAIGALAGGGWQTLRHYGDRLLGRLTGERLLRVDDSIIRALGTRQLQLVQALRGRGHAALTPAAYSQGDDAALWPKTLPRPLRQARNEPRWSELNAAVDITARHDAVMTLLEELQQLSRQAD